MCLNPGRTRIEDGVINKRTGNTTNARARARSTRSLRQKSAPPDTTAPGQQNKLSKHVIIPLRFLKSQALFAPTHAQTPWSSPSKVNKPGTPSMARWLLGILAAFRAGRLPRENLEVGLPPALDVPLTTHPTLRLAGTSQCLRQ